MDPIHIALPSDENYVQGLTVTAVSIALYAHPDARLHFHILDGGIREESFAGFTACVARVNGKACFSRYRIDDSAFADFPAWSGNKMTYARLLLPALLRDVDFVIYCDSDFLWLADIGELWSERDKAFILQSSRDGCPRTERLEQEWCERHGFPFDPERYFCAGLSFYNLSAFRHEKIVDQVFDFIRKFPDVCFADQTALNHILRGRVRLLPQKWQRFTRDVMPEELSKPIVLHYAGEVPWKRGGWWELLTDTIWLWHRFNDRIVGAQGGSLAIYFKPWQILFRRSLARLLVQAPLRYLFYRICQISGRGGYCAGFDTWVRPLRLNAITFKAMRSPANDRPADGSRSMLVMTDSMVCGGVEKSLLTLMQIFSDYNIELLLTHRRGSLMSLVPDSVAIKEVRFLTSRRYEWQMGLRKSIVAACASLRLQDVFRLLLFNFCYLRIVVPRGLRRARLFLNLVAPADHSAAVDYSLAIAYGDTPEIVAYVADRVRARRKIAWMHNDFPVSFFDRTALVPYYRKYDVLGACSSELARSLSERLKPAGCIVTHFPHIIDADTYCRLAAASPVFAARRDRLCLVSIGRVCEQKGFDIALDVCRELVARGYPLHWIVVGDGPDLSGLRCRAAELGLAGVFELVGQKTNPYPYYAACDIYVQPSRYEGFCLTLAEAKVFRKPIVTTNFFGAREQIEDGVTGLIVPVDKGRLADAIARLLDHPNLRIALSENLGKVGVNASDRRVLRERILGQCA